MRRRFFLKLLGGLPFVKLADFEKLAEPQGLEHLEGEHVEIIQGFGNSLGKTGSPISNQWYDPLEDEPVELDGFDLANLGRAMNREIDEVILREFRAG